MADRVASDEVGRQFVDDDGDHAVEIGDLVVQFEITTGQRFEADPICRLDFPIGGQVGPPGRQRSNQLHAGHECVAGRAVHLARHNRFWTICKATRRAFTASCGRRPEP